MEHEYHNLDRLFGYDFYNRYMAFLNANGPGTSIEWTERLVCMMCGSLVAFPVAHKDWHKRNKDIR